MLTPLSNDQYDTLFHLSHELDGIEALLRQRRKSELADTLVEFQQRAGNVYAMESEGIPVPDGIRIPSVQEMASLFRTIRNLPHANKETEARIEYVIAQLGIQPLTTQRQP